MSNKPYSEEITSKIETRYILNHLALKYFSCALKAQPNFLDYILAHKIVDGMEDVLLGYIAGRSEEWFTKMNENYINTKKKFKPNEIKRGSSRYMNFLYGYNRKRFALIRRLMSRYGIDLYRNRSVIKD